MKSNRFLFVLLINSIFLTIKPAAEPAVNTGWKTIPYPTEFINRDFAQTAWTGNEYIIWSVTSGER